MKLEPRLALFACLTLAAALMRPGVAGAQSAGSRPAPDASPSAPAATFNQHVAPILHTRCAQCHHPGGAGPFDLLTFADASRRAGQIAAVTRSGFMPPWQADGHPGEFVAQPRLTPEDVALLARWAAAPVEGPGPAPQAPTFPQGWYLGQPDLVVTVPAGYTLPGEGSDAFRIFALPLPVGSTRYVRGIEFHPGNAARGAPRQHPHRPHRPVAAARRRRPGAGLRRAHGPLGGVSGRPFPRLDARPGRAARATRISAWRLDPGTDLVVQLHLQPSGKPEQVQPTIGFYFGDRPPDPDAVDSAPRARRASTSRLGTPATSSPTRYTLPVDATLLAVQPHAHYRAVDVTGTATLPDGTTRTLIHIADWDFRWQHVYRYTEPIRLPRGTTVAMRYVYDNCAANPRNPQVPPGARALGAALVR